MLPSVIWITMVSFLQRCHLNQLQLPPQTSLANQSGSSGLKWPKPIVLTLTIRIKWLSSSVSSHPGTDSVLWAAYYASNPKRCPLTTVTQYWADCLVLVPYPRCACAAYVVCVHHIRIRCMPWLNVERITSTHYLTYITPQVLRTSYLRYLA